MIFEVDSNLDNPDDLINDENAAREAREQYDRDRSGRLTILPCAICYVPLMRILSDESLSDLFERSGYTKADNEDKQKILQKRLDGHTNLGQVEYIFDLGNWNPYFSDLNGKKYGTLLQILQYPFSVGSIHVKPQAEEPNKTVADKPSIDPRYYEGAHGQLDFEVMKQSTRFAKKIISTAPLSDIIRGPSYPSASELDDESLLEKWIVENTITDWHPIGTCAMGGRGGVKDGVVDERLRAYGLNGLRVIDASTMPLQISAHPQATVYAIAEKGASMILEDHVRDDHK